MAAPPPKPWEGASIDAPEVQQSSAQTGDTTQPVVPPRPANLMNQNPMYDNVHISDISKESTLAYNSMYQPYPSAGIGSGMYGDAFGGGYGSYGNRFGAPYSRFSGGMTGMGNFGSYGGYPGYGGYRPGIGYGDPNSLGQRMESGTMATFQLLESIVGTFGGFAQMLESTFMATHSSFYAMLGVAEQFRHLKGYLAEVLSAFNVLRWMKLLIAKAQGKKLPERSTNGQNRPRKKPLIIFLLAVIGVPYLMAKLVKIASKSQVNQHLLIGSNGERIDPRNLKFVKCIYDYTPPEERKSTEIVIKEGDIIAVLERSGEWIQGRTRDGRYGWIPKNFVKEIE
ncbi:hypothetical protein E3Q24_01018 [Wallemia mellicola]|nr:hypothetical protein E3Q24_01018 [Wallemia mellicola]